MKALQILKIEHGMIRQYLTTLSFALEKMERGERPPKEFFEQAVIFAREFVDTHHHYKEELQMFQLLAQKKSGEIDAPLAALRNQHETGRNHVAAILKATIEIVDGDEVWESDLIESLAAYISMLRRHINIEDHIFYPMAEQVLTDAEHEQLLVSFKQVDDKAAPGFLDDFRERLLKMDHLLNKA